MKLNIITFFAVVIMFLSLPLESAVWYSGTGEATYLENVIGTDEWGLSEVWPSTAWFHFYITIEAMVEGKEYEIMKEIYEV